MSTDFYNITEKAFIEVIKESDTVVLNWKGIVDCDNADIVVGEYLLSLHDECKKMNIVELTTNFSNVEFMNSSSIKNIITWFREIAKDEAYKVKLIIDNSVSWQDVTFCTLQLLIEDLEIIYENE